MNHLKEILNCIEPASREWEKKAEYRLKSLAMPPWALGKMLDLAKQCSAISRSIDLDYSRRKTFVLAGDHGVLEEGVSAYPKEVTAAIVKTILSGGAGINIIAKESQSDIEVVDLGMATKIDYSGELKLNHQNIAMGTQNMTKGPAMSRAQAIKSIEVGLNLLKRSEVDYDVFAIGEMGIGNTTPATAILCSLGGCLPEEVTGRGAGIDDKMLQHKILIIKKSLEVNACDPNDPIAVLASLGGYEIGGMVGLILGCALAKKPVLIDGFIATSAALIAQRINPLSTDYMIAAHKSAEPGHIKMLKILNKEPFLDFQFRLGEGTGATLALPMLNVAASLLKNMFTLEEALAIH